MPNIDPNLFDFEAVRAKEIEEIVSRRKEIHPPKADPPANWDQDLSGLAISGGGIRSATFGLGVIQALAHFKILRKFDYLSTVSGGGYIGSWLSAWHHRLGGEKNPDLNVRQVNDLIEAQLQPNRAEQIHDAYNARIPKKDNLKLKPGFAPEPEPIRHLRSYSNYMAPNLSLFSADGWVLIATYLRNFLLNLCVIIMLFVTVFMALRGVVEFFCYCQTDGIVSLVSTLVGIGFFGFSRLTIYRLLKARQTISPATIDWLIIRYRIFVVLGTLIAAVGIGAFLANSSNANIFLTSWNFDFGFYFGFGLGAANALDKFFCCLCSQPFQGRRLAMWTATGFLTGIIGAWIVYSLTIAFTQFVQQTEWATYRIPILITFLPALFLFVYMLSSFVQIGLVSRSASNEERELWSSWNADLLLLSLGWVVTFGLILFAPLVFLPNERGQWFGWIVSLLPAGWASVVFISLRTAMSSKTSGQTPNRLREVVAKIGPWVFLIGFTVFAATICHLVIMKLIGMPNYSDSSYLSYVNDIVLVPRNIYLMIIGLAGWFVLFFVISYCVDINHFSMNAVYANRLTRCYLGATRPKQFDPHEPSMGMQLDSNNPDNPFRNPGFLTGLDQRDDLPIRDLARTTDQSRLHSGPYHIINTAINLTGGSELAWAERMADSFILSPHFCGSGSTGYANTTNGKADSFNDDYAGGVTLGQAVSISGAALSPNMGYHSTPAVTALLTVFNARLGAWLGNPNNPKKRKKTSPTIGLNYLLKEVFSRTTAKSDYVYLSDGGHFENLGVYELIRRRCRCILAIDGGADPNREFEDLSNLIRKVRIDFGIRIDLDIEGLEKEKGSHKSYTHVSAGRIRYSDIDQANSKKRPGQNDNELNKEHDGILIYVKLSMTGDESTDVEGYRKLHPSFPHEPTADQFFSESQFESYRTLGYHIGHELFENLHLSQQSDPNRSIRSIFNELYADWHPVPRDVNKEFAGLNDAFLAVQGQLRSRDELNALEQECNRPQGIFPACAVTSSGIVRTMVTQMLTLLENVFFGLDLEENWDVSMNTGWKVVFATWFTSTHFAHHAREVEMNFSSEFRRFVTRRYGNFLTLLWTGIPFSIDHLQEPFPIMLAELARN